MSLFDLSLEDTARIGMIVARMHFQEGEDRPTLRDLLAAVRDSVRAASTSKSGAFVDPVAAAGAPATDLADEARRVAADLYGEEYAYELWERIVR